MVDDAHRVTFESVADPCCWGSGTTGHGCGREATSQAGLCDLCHDEISRRIEEGRPERRSSGGGRRIVEVDVELNCAGAVVSRTTLWSPHPVTVSYEGESQQVE